MKVRHKAEKRAIQSAIFFSNKNNFLQVSAVSTGRLSWCRTPSYLYTDTDIGNGAAPYTIGSSRLLKSDPSHLGEEARTPFTEKKEDERLRSGDVENSFKMKKMASSGLTHTSCSRKASRLNRSITSIYSRLSPARLGSAGLRSTRRPLTQQRTQPLRH